VTGLIALLIALHLIEKEKVIEAQNNGVEKVEKICLKSN
jgi:hypothetical protein